MILRNYETSITIAVLLLLLNFNLFQLPKEEIAQKT